ncbi:MAG: type IA DNA topoisomerase [Lachnospiraceae bacterium]|nr:type IA DNA topoisomerase [Lachnospiraceae bacterium]
MGKRVFIAEKPSVAREFANALDLTFRSRDGFMEAEDTIVTWCVGHLVTMCYPDVYDEKYRKWSLSTIPFLPQTFRYEVIDGVRKQFNIVSRILNDPQVDLIYICTDSGREGEYIYRLVAQEAGVKDKEQRRVWIDSQTKEEILRGIREAKDDSAYDNLGAAAYLRAKEDYLMGINFSRALTLKYGRGISRILGTRHSVIAVGRVMTCVLGMVVKREREIRHFVKTPFFRIIGSFSEPDGEETLQAEWYAAEGSAWYASPSLYKENGFLKREDAEAFLQSLQESAAEGECSVLSVSRKKEKKNPPLLYNLAELQNDCAKFLKISPDQALNAAQTLYERKLTTYPRTDARVLSSAVAKEIGTNLKGLSTLREYRPYLEEILRSGSYKTIGSTRYTNDKAITDHYAIIPTGQGLRALEGLGDIERKVYEMICRRFLSIFYPPAVYDRTAMEILLGKEHFRASLKSCAEEGYLVPARLSFLKKREDERDKETPIPAFVCSLKKEDALRVRALQIKEGETMPPRRYNSGSLILTMENAGQFIEEEELREQIRGSGIGTSATRAEILKKLISNSYLALQKKTQIITPTRLGEMIYDTVDASLRPLLDPKLTASWEMGLTRVSEGTVTEAEYMEKLDSFVARRTNYIKETDFSRPLEQMYRSLEPYYAGSGQSGRPPQHGRRAGKRG